MSSKPFITLWTALGNIGHWYAGGEKNSCISWIKTYTKLPDRISALLQRFFAINHSCQCWKDTNWFLVLLITGVFWAVLGWDEGVEVVFFCCFLTSIDREPTSFSLSWVKGRIVYNSRGQENFFIVTKLPRNLLLSPLFGNAAISSKN